MSTGAKYVKSDSGYFKSHKTPPETPRLLEYISSTIGVLERLSTGDDLQPDERQNAITKLIENVTTEITSSGKDLNSLFCHNESSMLLEHFISLIGLPQIQEMIKCFGQQRQGYDTWLYSTISDVRGSFVFGKL
jgi:hypothetical protein